MLRMTAQKRLIPKKNADPNGRIRSKDELRPQVEHSIENEQKEELEAPEQYFVQLSELKKAPKPEEVVTKTFGGFKMQRVLVNAGPQGWWKVRHTESKAVKSRKIEAREDFDLREDQHVRHHCALVKANMADHDETSSSSMSMSIFDAINEPEDDAAGLGAKRYRRR